MLIITRRGLVTCTKVFKTFPIETDEHLLMVLRYVERNPARANFSRQAEDWFMKSLKEPLDHGDLNQDNSGSRLLPFFRIMTTYRNQKIN